MNAVVAAILAILQYAPQVAGLVTEVENLIASLGPIFNSTDKVTLDKALADARAADDASIKAANNA